MTQDTGADSRMPAEIDGKPVISAFRRLPRYGSTAHTYIVITSEGRQDNDGINLYTVGIAFYAYGRNEWVFMDDSTRAGHAGERRDARVCADGLR